MLEKNRLAPLDSRKEAKDKNLLSFPKGTVVWPLGSRRGVLRQDILAHGIDQKIKGLPGFQALQRMSLYLDRRYWSLPKGTFFGAYQNNAQKVEKLTKKSRRNRVS